jgi:hypothetical protein
MQAATVTVGSAVVPSETSRELVDVRAGYTSMPTCFHEDACVTK